ncbi:hypothetical protein LguiB_014797 [Lonicera macranthoides]
MENSTTSLNLNINTSNVKRAGGADISDEVIVINKEATAEALVALSSGFLADSQTDEEIDAGAGDSRRDEAVPQMIRPIRAGLAGLAAARQLLSFGFKVIVLEGRKRAGGRVYTMKINGEYNGESKEASADLGGSMLTGTLGNPLGILARQLSYALHKVRDKCPLYIVDGKPGDPGMDLKVETAFNRILEKASKLRQLMGEVSQDVSLGAALETFWQVYRDDMNAKEMNLYNWHLANLEYANAGLLSKLSLAFWDQDDPYDMGGDHCFLPGGNGRLVQALSENVPILYEKTVHTIRYGSDGVQVLCGNQVFEGDMALCFGLLNKVVILFPYVFWGTDLDTFGHLSNNLSDWGLFYSYASVTGGPFLIALVAGEAAHEFESMPATDALSRVLEILRGIYEPKRIAIPNPLQAVCTRWGSDPFSLGSYSNVAVGASGDDYDILAESVGDGRLFFAGEASTRHYPATMHGAFLTGLREAAHMAHHANLFREPDLEFGIFSVNFDRKNIDPKSTAVLRVTFCGHRKKSHECPWPDQQQHSNKLLFQQLQSHFNQQQELHIYTLLFRQQAQELRKIRGDSVIDSIKAERGTHMPTSTSLTLKFEKKTSKPRVATLKQELIRKAKVMGNKKVVLQMLVRGLDKLAAALEQVVESVQSMTPSRPACCLFELIMLQGSNYDPLLTRVALCTFKLRAPNLGLAKLGTAFAQQPRTESYGPQFHKPSSARLKLSSFLFSHGPQVHKPSSTPSNGFWCNGIDGGSGHGSSDIDRGGDGRENGRA